MILDDRVFDSTFTFYRGSCRSQNDMILANHYTSVESFKIMDKMIYSDHCPTATTYVIDPICSLDFVSRCTDGAFNDDHLDINNIRMKPLIVSKINWLNAIPELETQSRLISERIDSGICNDALDALLSTSIHNIQNEYLVLM